MTSGPLTGTLLDGRYQVAEIVGAGGFGTVYAATHVHLGAKVAIKVPVVVGDEGSDVAEAIGRFVEEGRMLKRLRHPNVAAALDIGLLPEDESGCSLPYLVLEWCSGRSLKEWRSAQAGRIPPATAWRILRPVIEAIAHAHERGLAHRDIKPANILLEDSPRGALHPRVIDFGIAKVLGGEPAGSSGMTLTMSSRRAFTPTYAAPEQLLGLRTGPATDVYALALVALEVISGHRVFSTEGDARRALASVDPPTPQRLGLDLGPWNDVLARALARRPTDRYPDAGALLRALGDPPERFGGASPGADGAGSTAVTVRQGRPRSSEPIDRAESAPPTARATADHAEVEGAPSSRTARTRSATPARHGGAMPARRSASAVGGAALVVVGTTSVFIGALWLEAAHAPSPPALETRATSPMASVAPLPPPLPAPALHSLSAHEIAARAEAAGAQACVSVEDEYFRQVRCRDVTVTLGDNRTELAPDPLRLGRIHGEYAAAQAQARHLDGRFAIGDGSGIVFVGPPWVVDDVAAHVLAGVEHERLYTTDGFPQPSVPRAVAQWSGDELVTRLVAIGAFVSKERRTPGMTSVIFRLDGAYGVLILEKSPRFPVASLVRPFVFATAGDQLLTLRGDAPLVTADLLTKVLDGAEVTERGEHR